MRTTGGARRRTSVTTVCRRRRRIVPRDAGHRRQRILSRLSGTSAPTAAHVIRKVNAPKSSRLSVLRRIADRRAPGMERLTGRLRQAPLSGSNRTRAHRDRSSTVHNHWARETGNKLVAVTTHHVTVDLGEGRLSSRTRCGRLYPDGRESGAGSARMSGARCCGTASN